MAKVKVAGAGMSDSVLAKNFKNSIIEWIKTHDDWDVSNSDEAIFKPDEIALGLYSILNYTDEVAGTDLVAFITTSKGGEADEFIRNLLACFPFALPSEKEVLKAVKRIYSYESKLKQKGYGKGDKTLRDELKKYIRDEIKNAFLSIDGYVDLDTLAFYTSVEGYFYQHLK